MPRTIIKNSADKPSKRNPRAMSRLGIQGADSFTTPKPEGEPVPSRISGMRTPTAKARPARPAAANQPAFRPIILVATMVIPTSAKVEKRIAVSVTKPPGENMGRAPGTSASCSPHSRVGLSLTAFVKPLWHALFHAPHADQASRHSSLYPTGQPFGASSMRGVGRNTTAQAQVSLLNLLAYEHPL